MPRFCLLLSIFLACLPTFADAAGREVTGPVEVDVVRVIDGDTFVADAHVWPGHVVRISVRVRGVDTPELRSRCADEKSAALRAREALAALLSGGPPRLLNIGGGKYYGRVLADVQSADGQDVADVLIRGSFAVAYEGGRRRSACDR